jgi:hypothetical protein
MHLLVPCGPGSVYFGIMLFSNLDNIATFIVSEFNQRYFVALFLIHAPQLGTVCFLARSGLAVHFF